MDNKLPYLNLGCGYHYHPRWTNIDFTSTGEGVIAHNLLKGIPFNDGTFEVVYHSNILEHFQKKDGKFFIQECYRVLKEGGTIRIAVPDLQQIVKEYIRVLELLEKNPDDDYLRACYEWMVIELYDQTVRNKVGGEMLNYLCREEINNIDFVIKRCGIEVEELVKNYKSLQAQITHNKSDQLKNYLRFIHPKTWTSKFKSIFLKLILGKEYRFYQEGKFRLSGEIHFWMYDHFSLRSLLKETGFKNINIVSAFESNIKNWNEFGLEVSDNRIRKPDSFFIEAVK